MRQLLDLEGERLEIMDAHGVDMHVLALTSPGVQTLPAGEAVALAQRSNDLLAALIKRIRHALPALPRLRLRRRRQLPARLSALSRRWV